MANQAQLFLACLAHRQDAPLLRSRETNQPPLVFVERYAVQQDDCRRRCIREFLQGLATPEQSIRDGSFCVATFQTVEEFVMVDDFTAICRGL